MNIVKETGEIGNNKSQKRFKGSIKMYKKDISTSSKVFILLLFMVTIIGMFYVSSKSKGGLDLYLGVYGSVMVMYLLGKMTLSFFYKPYSSEYVPDLKVSVVIPSYNESPSSLLSTVSSILHQDYPIHEIIVVDDGSSDKSGYATLKELETTFQYSSNKNVPTLLVHRIEKNVGKRHAQAWAFERITGDIIVTLDSDAHIEPNAVRELISPFQDKDVKATTGHISARNKNDNLFTRLIDMRYDNAFRVERSAQSVTGNILVCSGCFSAYRKEIIINNLDHYKNQMFLGEKVQFGDDRCLTNYAIIEGKTVYQSTAISHTDVPSSIKQFLKQQVRWNKSFFRESLIAMKIGIRKPVVLVWAVLEMLLWILFGTSIILAIIKNSSTFGGIIFIYYFCYMCLSAYARNVFYILKNPFIFLLAPVYGLIHLTLLVPLRLYALLTIKENKWGTR